ncbi:heavy metal sensor histidine kinase [Massilia sp. Mn16-1_5]|uniref:heavy metal sensor histidine kinase n=1 Tax=Massilia sp. Mn16-1_5 TaxID=2079199 RepID=UPI00109E9EE5|nr:heavy metal sensor histidine kinase [Massilia sp. Mn16-1_5]THC39699.1 two-component sensor histidine kinase [Massilia sp. Mn16-1_5]
MSVWKRSLTMQLGALFAAIAVVVFAAVGIVLYQALARQLQERDDADLIDRISLIRHLLDETATATDVGKTPHQFLDAVDIHGGYLLVIETIDGRPLLRNVGQRKFTVPAKAVATTRAPTANDVIGENEVGGGGLRILTALGEAADGSVVRIVLARTPYDRSVLLAAYRLKVMAAVIGGAILTALMGFLLVKRGLRQVWQLADQARNVTATNLAVRLDAATAPAELLVLADAFNAVLDRLQKSFEHLSQFSADLAHDMRTPLNNLMVQTQVALSQPRSNEEYQNLLSSNHEEFERMARMVESMLFLARADHEEILLSTERLDANKALEQIAEYFEAPAAEAGIGIKVRASGTVLADLHLLRRAVNNLVANAVRYTPKGGTIRLEASAADGGMRIAVVNPGVGISTADLPRLFDRFYRADSSRSSAARSAGLGLAIVRSIMTLHRGRVSASSEQGLTRFELFFPDRRTET